MIVVWLADAALAFQVIDCSVGTHVGVEYGCDCEQPRHRKNWPYNIDPDATALWPELPAAVANGFAAWENVPGSTLDIHEVPSTGPLQIWDGEMTVGLGSDVPFYWLDLLPPSWSAVASLGVEKVDDICYQRDYDIAFNDAQPIKIYKDKVPSEVNGLTNFSGVVIAGHEFGHILGLAHASNQNAGKTPGGLMLPIYPMNGEYGSITGTADPNWHRGPGKVRLGEDEFRYVLIPPVGVTNRWVEGGVAAVNVLATKYGPRTLPNPPCTGPYCDSTENVWPYQTEWLTCGGEEIPPPLRQLFTNGETKGPWLAVQATEILNGSPFVKDEVTVLETLWLHATEPLDPGYAARVQMSNPSGTTGAAFLVNGTHTNRGPQITWTIPAAGPGGVQVDKRYRLEYEAKVATGSEMSDQDNIVVSDYFVHIIDVPECP